MKSPKVSVIVPVYNTEQYLRRCLRSLLRQTLEDLEIVAIDDCSTDGSPEIL
ncbi:MAG: glycosyltransferase family 2 protein, partial [Lachnospiraceae bacterium]